MPGLGACGSVKAAMLRPGHENEGRCHRLPACTQGAWPIPQQQDVGGRASKRGTEGGSEPAGHSWPQQGPHMPRRWRGGSSASSASCWGRELSLPCCLKERMPPARPNPTEKSLASFGSDLRPSDAARLSEAAADGWRRDSVPPCTICILHRQPGTAPQHPQPHLPTVASPHGAVPTPGPPSEALGPRILPKIPATVPG